MESKQKFKNENNMIKRTLNLTYGFIHFDDLRKSIMDINALSVLFFHLIFAFHV